MFLACYAPAICFKPTKLSPAVAFLEIWASTCGPGPYGPRPLNLKEFSKSNILLDHIWNAHCSRSMFTICSWSSMLFKYGPGAYLTYRIEYSSRLLTLKWPRYFYSRWCTKGGSMEPPPRENHFPTGILQWNLHHIYVRDIKNHNSAKNFFECCTVSKWRPNNRFLFRVISILAKFWKTTFPKEFFNEIWLKEEEYV